MSLVVALQDLGARQREQSEALARPARVRFFVRVTGVGESRLTGKNGIFFGAYMLEEPTFTWGAALLPGAVPSAGTLPICTAVVLGYHRAKAAGGEFFTGADVGFVVESGAANVGLNFSLTFEGVTLRTTAPLTGPIR